MLQSVSASDSEGTNSKNKASGFFPWLFLFAVTASLISAIVASSVRDLRGQSDSGAVQCAKLCELHGMKLYDGAADLCECRDPKESE